MNHWTLSGKCALITGGTKGIGLAAAEEFLALGAEVFIVARNESEVSTQVSEWQARGLPAFGRAADVTSPADREHIAEAVARQWGRLDVLVNNVGMNIRKPFAEYADAEIRSVFETNLFSAVTLTQLLFPLLQKGRGASVINVSSVAASVDVRSGAPYGMTKAAELQLSRSLAVEWAPMGIRVNAVSPWYTRTPLAEPVLQQPERLEAILRRTPLGRIAEPEEPAAAIAFLAMDKSSYITGQNIIVDGGMTASGL
jgi:tropinone reductase I